MGKENWESEYNESELVPVPFRELISVEEPTGLIYVHRPLASEVRELFTRTHLEIHTRQPRLKTTWLAEYARKETHRYPTTDDERHLALEVGNAFIEVGQLIHDPDGLAQYFLMIAAAFALFDRCITDEQFCETFRSFTQSNGNSPWDAIELEPLEPQRWALYTESAIIHSATLAQFLDIPLPDGKTHPFPETGEQKEIAERLKTLLTELTEAPIQHFCRVFLKTFAARLLQIGTISTKDLLFIADAGRKALDETRNARQHDEETERAVNEEPDDEDNLSPYGSISWG